MDNPLPAVDEFDPLWWQKISAEMQDVLARVETIITRRLPRIANSFVAIVPPFMDPVPFLQIELYSVAPMEVSERSLSAYIDAHVRTELKMRGKCLNGAETMFVTYDHGILRVTWPGNLRLDLMSSHADFHSRNINGGG